MKITTEQKKQAFESFEWDEPDFSEHEKRERIQSLLNKISETQGVYLVDRYDCEVSLEEYKAFAEAVILAVEEL